MHVFDFFSVHEENCMGWPQMGPGRFFPTNPDLADILGRTDLNFDICFFDFLDPKFLDFQVPDFQNLTRAGPGQAWASPSKKYPPTPPQSVNQYPPYCLEPHLKPTCPELAPSYLCMPLPATGGGLLFSGGLKGLREPLLGGTP